MISIGLRVTNQALFSVFLFHLSIFSLQVTHLNLLFYYVCMCIHSMHIPHAVIIKVSDPGSSLQPVFFIFVMNECVLSVFTGILTICFQETFFEKYGPFFSPLFQFVGQLVYYMSMVFTICHRLLVFTFLSPLFYKVTKLVEIVAIREWKIFIDFSIDIGQRSRSNSLTWIFTLSNCPSPCTRYITLLVAAEL